MKISTLSNFLLASAIWQIEAADSTTTWRQPSPIKPPIRRVPSETSLRLAANVVEIRAGGKLAVSKQSDLMTDVIHRLKIGFYFGLWYALNIVYNSKFSSPFCDYSSVQMSHLLANKFSTKDS
jgi:hypothetical protein